MRKEREKEQGKREGEKGKNKQTEFITIDGKA